MTCIARRAGVSSRRLLPFIANHQEGGGGGRRLYANLMRRSTSGHFYYSSTSSKRINNDDNVDAASTTEQVQRTNATQGASHFLNGINGISYSKVVDAAANVTKQHPVHHYTAGGTPCDEIPQPYELAETGEDSLYTLVLLRHGESEWNALNRKWEWNTDRWTACAMSGSVDNSK